MQKDPTRTLSSLAGLALATIVLATSSMNAEVIFTESFEDPAISEQWVISGFNTDGPWPGWVGVNRYTGILNTSVNVPDSELFINSFGDQVAYVFNNLPGEETGASLTTTPDSLDAKLTEGTTYTLTFNTASGSGASIGYHVELLAIDDSVDPPVETVLGAATGSLTSNDLSANSDKIVFTPSADHASLGERVAIRLRKGAGDWHHDVYYDNVQLDAASSEGPGPSFVRGDTDANGLRNITDGIYVLNFLFLGGDDLTCQDAADTDDNGAVNITDGIYILNFLFLGGDQPPLPFPDCGVDPTDDSLDCREAHAACEG